MLGGVFGPMPRIYRSTVFAIGLIALASLGMGQSPENLRPDQPVEQEAAEGEPAEEPTVEPEAIVEPPTAPAQPAAETHDEDAGGKEDSEPDRDGFKFWGDTWAQWAMAATGVVAVGISAWAVWLVRRTLIETRRAVQSERAWVSFSGIETFADGDEIGFAVMWTNSGRSPALDLQFYIASDILNRGDEDIIRFDRPQPKIIHKSTPFGPGMSKSTNVCRLGPKAFDLWTSGAIRVIIYSFVGYRDFYSDDPRHTEFCGEIEYISETVTPDGRLNIETYIHPHGHQNTGS